MRWLLLDEVLTIKKGCLARTRSKIPVSTVSPEILLQEMMAQTGALLLGAEREFAEDIIFAKIEQSSFKGELVAGAEIEIEASSEGLHQEGAWIEARILNSAQEIASSRFMLINVGHLKGEDKTPVTFHTAFMEHFRVKEKVCHS